ncbi:MAG: M20 family metallopeptidase [Gemmatimonadota bacterium]|jgi:glutamate carboxypeptidase
MVDLLLDLVSLESPTDVRETQVPVQQRLTDELERRGFAVRHLEGSRTGGHLYARPVERRRGIPGQLLIGHCDTVWPVGTLESMPAQLDGRRVRGPGSFDMKAGLVQGLFAVEALRGLGLQPPATPVWLVNSDEEIGSPESSRWVRLLARHVARAFVLEPAFGLEGYLKTRRKGVSRYRVTVKGVAAHAGLEPTKGSSAIVELANVIQRLHAFTDLERGTTVNVGKVRGGSRPNVVAAEASAEVDVRVTSTGDAEELDRKIRALQPSTEGTEIIVEGGTGVPPMERTARNRSLWEEAVAAAERLGIDLGEFMAGGRSDGNTTSRFTATLDGLGAVGEGAHALHESVNAPALVERAALLAELLMSPVRALR